MSTLTARHITPTKVQPLAYNVEKNFSLLVHQGMKTTSITMKLFTSMVNTFELPLTYPILKASLPSILQSKCFNDEKLPFAVEVKRTEIGHLFEHILLEYLCELKLAKGYNKVVYSGRTNWNWIKEQRGIFHISISSSLDDSDILPLALEKTIRLIKVILNPNPASTMINDTMPVSESAIQNQQIYLSSLNQAPTKHAVQ